MRSVVVEIGVWVSVFSVWVSMLGVWWVSAIEIKDFWFWGCRLLDFRGWWLLMVVVVVVGRFASGGLWEWVTVAVGSGCAAEIWWWIGFGGSR